MDEAKKYLNALLNGDDLVIQTIYNRFFPKVKSFILENKGKEEDVQDVFHDALMYLLIKHKEKTLQLQSFEGYLFTICKNIWRRELKNKKTRVMNNETIHLVDKETDFALYILEQKQLDFYLEKFQLLSDNCKEILGSYYNKMSYEEILKDLSYSSINTVRQRVFKCRSKIIDLIKQDKKYHKLKK